MLDLVVRGGKVLDPAAGRTYEADVAVAAGRLVALEPRIRDRAKETLDASGCYVSPGFVDFHAHVFWGVNFFAVDADPYCTANGVTTVVDCGSSGSMNFPGFRRYVIEPSRTRILAFLNIAKHGIQSDPGELLNMQYADVDGVVALAREHSDVVVGVKVRLGHMMVGDENGPAAYDAALRAAENAGLRLMVHIGGTTIPVAEIVARMRPGDVVTHCLHAMSEAIVDDARRLRPEVREARARGVLFDLGHARGMLSLDVARAALAQGFGPDTLSTDAYTMRRPRAGIGDPGLDMPVVLSKFLALGWSLEQVVAACTVRPATILGRQNQFGALAVGSEADITIFRVDDEPVTFVDIHGAQLRGTRVVRPLWTIRAGDPAPARDNPGFRDRLEARSYVPPEPPDCCG